MKQSSRVALVTGASSGMGKAFAQALLGEGMVVYAVARRVDQMTELRRLGAITLAMDITREQDVERVVAHIKSQHGAVDVLLNNAGFGLYGAMEDTLIDDARYQFEVNLFGLARLTQALLPDMRSQGKGLIINISSMGGKVYTPLGSWYHATKHALEGWSDCLRLELRQFGINVVLIEPGAIDTEFGAVMLEPMLRRSENGAYHAMAQKVAAATRQSYKPGSLSKPQVIVDLVLKAVRSAHPKTRYVGGKYARPLMTIRKWLGDRIYDKIMMAMVR
ncbi:SDR family NAD(P)-dependent oxidoreductase [Pseudomonas sp. TH04]|uniref:oxidoreductase n=1 Tax=Pseudomonas sp. TH04 TaxID=2796370 RepID=UPI0019115AC8|nr:oxidoreductase [Pseudomonas sp. TH04]MBK5544724.1 SDR family NAD(P)-dependent oxidoreductase [Pseudomonas sp. TH04]